MNVPFPSPESGMPTMIRAWPLPCLSCTKGSRSGPPILFSACADVREDEEARPWALQEKQRQDGSQTCSSAGLVWFSHAKKEETMRRWRASKRLKSLAILLASSSPK